MAEPVTPTPAAPDQPLRDVDLFLDAPAPEQLVPKAEPPRPAETAASPTPAPSVSPHMTALAESFGIPDAASYGSDAELSRAITLANKFRATQPAQQPAQPASPVQAATPVEDDEIPDFDPTLYDEKLVKLGKAMKSQIAKYEAKIKEMQDGLPQHVSQAFQQAQAAEKGKKLLTDAVAESGYDPRRLEEAGMQDKIVGLASAMIRQAEQMGIQVDRKAMVQQVLPMVMGPAQPARHPSQPQQPIQRPAPPDLAAQRAALAAEQRARDEKGRFVPGAPTHRAIDGEANGSHTRQLLMDLGIDPKGSPPKDDHETFL